MPTLLILILNGLCIEVLLNTVLVVPLSTFANDFELSARSQAKVALVREAYSTPLIKCPKASNFKKLASFLKAFVREIWLLAGHTLMIASVIECCSNCVLTGQIVVGEDLHPNFKIATDSVVKSTL